MTKETWILVNTKNGEPIVSGDIENEQEMYAETRTASGKKPFCYDELPMFFTKEQADEYRQNHLKHDPLLEHCVAQRANVTITLIAEQP